MSEENVDIVRTIYQRWDTGDLSAFARLLEPDAEFVNPPDAIDAGTRHGPLGFAGAWQAVLDAFGSSRHEVEELREVGGHVIASVVFQAEGTHSGIAVEQAEFHVWTLRNGRIARFAWFRSMKEALEAAGAGE
jgi:uncharacterized protein